jgi:hypothetical protein
LSKRRIYFFCAVVAVTAILVLLLRRVLAVAHQPFEYMVAGTCVTAVAILAAFVVIVRRKWL